MKYTEKCYRRDGEQNQTEKQIKWRGKGQARLMGKVVAIYAQNLTGSLFSYGVLLHLNIYTVVVKKFLLRVAAFAAQLVRGDNPESRTVLQEFAVTQT